MYTVGGLLLIWLGGTTLQFVSSYSDGNFYTEPDECQTMAIFHEPNVPQTSDPPFRVVPESATFTALDVGTDFEVSLIGDSPFMGFMLEARTTDDGPPVGTFSLVDSELTQLQTCNGSPGKAVTQTDNQDKTQITVKWRVPEPGLYFFRAAFVQNFDVFWLRKAIILPTTTTAQTTTSLNTETGSTLGTISAYSSVLNTTFGPTTGTTAPTYMSTSASNQPPGQTIVSKVSSDGITTSMTTAPQTTASSPWINTTNSIPSGTTASVSTYTSAQSKSAPTIVVTTPSLTTVFTSTQLPETTVSRVTSDGTAVVTHSTSIPQTMYNSVTSGTSAYTNISTQTTAHSSATRDETSFGPPSMSAFTSAQSSTSIPATVITTSTFAAAFTSAQLPETTVSRVTSDGTVVVTHSSTSITQTTTLFPNTNNTNSVTLGISAYTNIPTQTTAPTLDDEPSFSLTSVNIVQPQILFASDEMATTNSLTTTTQTTVSYPSNNTTATSVTKLTSKSTQQLTGQVRVVFISLAFSLSIFHV